MQIVRTKKTKAMAIIGLIATVTAGWAYEAKAQNRTTTFQISKNRIETQLNRAFAGLRVRLDNIGPWRKSAGSYLQQDSRITLAVPGGGATSRRFDIPEQSFTINKAGGRHLRFYVSDLNVSRVRANIENKRGGRLFLTIDFESSGTEIQGRCVTRRGLPHRRRWETCKLNINRNVQVNNARLRVWAPIIERNGLLSYGDVKANFQADIRPDNRLCRLLKRACNAIGNRIEREVAKAIVPMVKQAINAQRGAVQRVLLRTNRNFSRSGFRITRIRDIGAAYRVTIRY